MRRLSNSYPTNHNHWHYINKSIANLVWYAYPSFSPQFDHGAWIVTTSPYLPLPTGFRASTRIKYVLSEYKFFITAAVPVKVCRPPSLPRKLARSLNSSSYSTMSSPPSLAGSLPPNGAGQSLIKFPTSLEQGIECAGILGRCHDTSMKPGDIPGVACSEWGLPGTCREGIAKLGVDYCWELDPDLFNAKTLT